MFCRQWWHWAHRNKIKQTWVANCDKEARARSAHDYSPGISSSSVIGTTWLNIGKAFAFGFFGLWLVATGTCFDVSTRKFSRIPKIVSYLALYDSSTSSGAWISGSSNILLTSLLTTKRQRQQRWVFLLCEGYARVLGWGNKKHHTPKIVQPLRFLLG